MRTVLVLIYSPHLLQRKKRHKQGIEAGNEAGAEGEARVIHLIVFKTQKDRKVASGMIRFVLK